MGKRRSKEEFCFFHLRHWNLADAMMHAPYVAATLKTWEETGEKKLAKLFARMGVPLAACKQKYVHMSIDLVGQLEAKLEEFGREVRLRYGAHTKGPTATDGRGSRCGDESGPWRRRRRWVPQVQRCKSRES